MTLTATMGHKTLAEDCNCLIAASFASHKTATSPPLAPVDGTAFPFCPLDDDDWPDDPEVDEEVEVDSVSFLSS